jgi:hypothetical protein
MRKQNADRLQGGCGRDLQHPLHQCGHCSEQAEARTGIAVADYGRRELIPAQTATWVIGGGRSGVMTLRAKWAFGKRADAEAFVKQHGGMLASFDDAVKATFEDMYTDIKTIRKRAQERKVHGMRREPMQFLATRVNP